jgi:hypothetical protein
LYSRSCIDSRRQVKKQKESLTEPTGIHLSLIPGSMIHTKHKLVHSGNQRESLIPTAIARAWGRSSQFLSIYLFIIFYLFLAEIETNQLQGAAGPK